jgi:hypothetical protein
MAEGATVGALKWVLGADTAQLEAAAARGSAAMRAAARAGEQAGQTIVSAMTRVGGTIAAAFAVENLVQFSAEAIRAVASIARFADQAGMTTQQFQGLHHALRDSQVPTEQLAQGFAIFSRNLSDMQRGTGPFLDFLRRAAPQLVATFRGARDTSEAFGILTDVVNQLGDRYDRVRILQMAMGEQGARLANTLLQGRTEIERGARAWEGHSQAAIQQAQEIERAYTELMARLQTNWQRFVIGTVQAFAPTVDMNSITSVEAAISRLTDRIRSGIAFSREAQVEYDRLTKRLMELKSAADNVRDMDASSQGPSAPTGPPQRTGLQLQADAIKAAQGELALFMARLQTLPPQTDFISTHFAAAWERMRAVMAANGETASAIAAARIGLLRQEDAARTQALGNAMMAGETLQRRENELFQARSNNLITEAELQRALNMTRSEYAMSQMQEMQSLGVTLTFHEQYQLTLERTNNALARGAITADQAGRAHRAAAQTAALAWLGAAGQIAGSLAQAFPKQKAFAVAAAVINVAEGITKAMTLPFPLNWAQAAAVAAAGLAQINAIKSANPGGSGSVPSVSGAGAGGTEPAQMQSQALTISLPAGRYTHEEVMQIIEGINDRVQNGATLISTKVQ